MHVQLQDKTEAMKYAQYLKALESDAPPEWRGKFIGYKRLKKAIKHLRLVLYPPICASKHPAGTLPVQTSPKCTCEFCPEYFVAWYSRLSLSMAPVPGNCVLKEMSLQQVDFPLNPG